MIRDLAHQFLYDMLLAREFEQAAGEEYTQGHIAGFLHLYPGEEAVAVGSLRAADVGDYVVSTYREHVHALVRGIPARAVMAELFGRADGCSRGYGGSMHLFYRRSRSNMCMDPPMPRQQPSRRPNSSAMTVRGGMPRTRACTCSR